jgi:hypothetical protein
MLNAVKWWCCTLYSKSHPHTVNNFFITTCITAKNAFSVYRITFLTSHLIYLMNPLFNSDALYMTLTGNFGLKNCIEGNIEQGLRASLFRAKFSSFIEANKKSKHLTGKAKTLKAISVQTERMGASMFKIIALFANFKCKCCTFSNILQKVKSYFFANIYHSPFYSY